MVGMYVDGVSVCASLGCFWRCSVSWTSHPDPSKGSKEVWVPMATVLSRSHGGNPCLESCFVTQERLPFCCLLSENLEVSFHRLHVTSKPKQTGICHLEILPVEMMMQNMSAFFIVFRERAKNNQKTTFSFSLHIHTLTRLCLPGLSPVLVSVSVITWHPITSPLPS